MTSINDLKTLLFFDVKRHNEIEKEASSIDTYVDLYSELLDLFTIDNIDNILDNLLQINIILDCLYDEKTVKSFDLLNLVYGWKYAVDDNVKDGFIKKLNRLLLKFKVDCGLELDKAKELRKGLLETKDIITTKRIISALKYNQAVTDEQIEFVKTRLEKEGINPTEIIIILEKIKIHNTLLNNRNDARIDYRGLYYVVNLMNQGYEEIDFPNRDNPTLNEFCDNFIATFDSTSIEMCEDVLNSITFYNAESMEYIYKKIMLYYQERIFEIIETLKTVYFYFDTEIIDIVREEYNGYYARYMIARNALDRLQQREIEAPSEETPGEEDKIKLSYATNSDIPEKCWFVKDLMDVREQSLERIDYLLDEFRKGKSNKLKPLSGKHGYSEIKDDQIIIVFRPIGADKASIMGVFIKKDDNDPFYRTIIGRQTIDVGEEYSKEVEEFYKRYIEENARRGSRK